MPIYAYICKECGFEKDALQKLSDPPLTLCPSCSNESLVKKLTAPNFQLKGSGWYVTDFRDNGKKPDDKKGDAKGAADNEATGSEIKQDAGAGKDKASEGAPTTSPSPASGAPASSVTAAPAPGGAGGGGATTSGGAASGGGSGGSTAS